MKEKYKNKYRSASARAQWWDYGWNAAYYVTICTNNRKHFFGDIQNEKMMLSHVGVLADVLWQEINQHAKFVELDAFVIMPNHVHGILIFDKSAGGHFVSAGDDNGTVGAGHALPLPPNTLSLPPNTLSLPPNDQPLPNPKSQSNDLTPGQRRFRNQGKNTLSSVVGSYKSAVTRHARRLGYEFAWQTRFYDHIIRNDASFQRIATYIENNVTKWKKDKFY